MTAKTFEEMVDAIQAAYARYITRANTELLVEMCLRLGLDPGFVADLMAHESKFSPSIQNPTPGSTATGLIQFIESTAGELGTTTTALRDMSFERQLEFVEDYYRGKIKSHGALTTEADTYMAVFYPAAIGNTSFEFPAFVTAMNKSIDVASYVANVRASADRLGGRVGPLLYPQGVWEIGVSSALSSKTPFVVAVVSLLVLLGFAVSRR